MPVYFQIARIPAALLAPTSNKRLIKEGLMLACLLALFEAADVDVSGRSKQQGRGYIFSHAETKDTRKGASTRGEKRGFVFVLARLLPLSPH